MNGLCGSHDCRVGYGDNDSDIIGWDLSAVKDLSKIEINHLSHIRLWGDGLDFELDSTW